MPDEIINLQFDDVYQGITFTKHNNEIRYYLERNLLGTLVPGLQKLLMLLNNEYQLKSVDYDDSFNPITWLAMYLMRNNPRYNPESKNHPYAKLLSEHVAAVEKMMDEEKKSLGNKEQ